MAQLTADEQRRVWRAFIERRGATPCRWTKAQLAAAAAATNDWMDANQASYLTALAGGAPGFAGANSTATDKTLLFALVALVRQGVL